MKCVILAGGLGTRLSEETETKPKPMVEIGERPILWHIMKIYSHYGINDFIICLGYKGYIIKDFFLNYYQHLSDVTVDLGTNEVSIHRSQSEPWRVTLVDTGNNSQTGGRLLAIKDYVKDDTFLMTYGDGVSNVNILDLIDFHKKHKKKCTITAVKPPGRFGAMNIDSASVVSKFLEKPQGDGNWINGGFFVMEPDVLTYIKNLETVLELEPLNKLASDGELSAYRHDNYWQAMDTLRDKKSLEALWLANKAPWKIWD